MNKTSLGISLLTLALLSAGTVAAEDQAQVLIEDDVWTDPFRATDERRWAAGFYIPWPDKARQPLYRPRDQRPWMSAIEVQRLVRELEKGGQDRER